MPSLRILLLRRLLPAMLALLLAGAATAYWIALRSATLAYDRSLLDIALAVSEQIRIIDGHPVLQLSPQARDVLLTDKFDQIFFVVHDAEGHPLAGDTRLPPLPDNLLGIVREEGRHYYDARIDRQAIRLAALRWEREGMELVVVAGETLVKRDSLVREILLGMVLPELALIAATLALVWFGIRAGLTPLDTLRHELAGRSHTDLSPVAASGPEEIQPVVAEINELLRRLEKSLSSQRHFISNAAHQLRTPIAALLAQFELLLRETPPEMRLQMAKTLAATRRLSHLVDQLLALARAEFSPTQPMPTVDLQQVASGGAENWLPQAIAKQIDLGFELNPAPTHGNALLLREMLSNLVDNALRHVPHGGTVTVSSGKTAETAWLCVEDNGPGIPAEERARVFERFYQPAGSTSDGCGLGLAIVDEIVRQHNGEILVNTSPTLGGTLIRASFPKA